MIEWPVLGRVRDGEAPLAALGKIDKDTLYRAGATGSAVMLGLWLVLG
jgi:hypothetical protein